MEETNQFLKEKRFLYISASLLLFLLSAFVIIAIIFGFLGISYFDKSAKGENVITVNGEAEVFATPDIAKIWFSVVSEKASVEKAQEDATERINKIISFIKDEGIDEKDIKTTNYNVHPVYEYVEKREICYTGYCPPQRERVLSGYRVSQSVEIKIRDVNKIGKILSGLGEIGVTNIDGPSFENENIEDLRLEARKKAIDNARKKAKELADALGVKLGDVVRFDESGGNYPYPIINKDLGYALGAGAPVPEIPTGENVIRANVSITYEIK